MRGIYRDVVDDPEGRRLHDTGWASNTIVRSAWPLLAALLRGEEKLGGLRFWAVGAGDPAWDAAPVAASPETKKLHAEIERLKVPTEAISYLDTQGTPTQTPTPRLEVSLTFSWGTALVLREFALVGGDAEEKPGTGYLVNYVVHRRIDLPKSSKLTRKLRLTLDPGSESEPAALPPHWLGKERIEVIDGVGPAYGMALRKVAIETVGDLARSEPASLKVAVPPMKLVEIRTRARLALGAAAALSTAGEALRPLSFQQVLGTTPAKLAGQLGILEADAARATEQAGVLQLTLDRDFLGGLSIGELGRSP